MTRYVYDNEDILLELDGSNNIVARYTHGPGIDEPLIMERAGVSVFYHADGLGSITDITNQSGSALQRYTYSSFGQIESQIDPNFVQAYTFTNREFDIETAVYFYRYRTYDQTTGRFLQEDPLLHRGNPQIHFNLTSLLSDPLLWTPHVYVRNDPVDHVDPLGLAIQVKSSWHGNYRSGFERQDRICTVPAWLGVLDEKPCTRQCCVEHDDCYTKYRCNASSWFGNFAANPGACQFCKYDSRTLCTKESWERRM
jgi:RHS repeat-associated protein